MSKVLVIGEYPSVTDEKRGELFSDAAGAELKKMLSEAGIDLADCAFTSVLKKRPFNTDLATVWTTVKKEAVEGGFENSQISGAFCHPSVVEAPRTSTTRSPESNRILYSPSATLHSGRLPARLL